MGTVHAKSPAGGGGDQYSTRDKVQLDGVQARVEKVHVDGVARTKDDVVLRAVRGLFDARDFQQVVLAAHEVRSTLESLGCFKNIGIYIDTDNSPGAAADSLEVTFFVDEMKRFVGGVNTLVGNNEGSLVFGMRLPNVAGRGEQLQTEYSCGTKNSTGFNATFSKPFIGWKNTSLTGAVYQQGNDFPWSGYRLTDRGGLIDFAFESLPKVRHSLRWEAVWREISCLERTTSFEVREEAGHSLKSAVKHILTMDRRDSPILPTRGLLFKLQQEFAGLGGDVGFLKHELELQTNHMLPLESVFQVSLFGGMMRSLSKDKMVSISDKFFLGGPLSLRGFTTRGVGPHSQGCATGATAFWAGAMHLYTLLPFRPGEGGFGDLIRTHLFVNVGNIGNFNFGDDYQENLKTLLTNVRLAYGAGIVLRIGQVARFELNYVVPTGLQPGDRANSGLQFGVGVSFL